VTVLIICHRGKDGEVASREYDSIKHHEAIRAAIASGFADDNVKAMFVRRGHMGDAVYLKGKGKGDT
jgi:hypothetical protein